MSEDEIGEIKDELKEYKKQLDALREDLKIVIKHSQRLHDSILEAINQPGNPRYEAEIPKLLAFRDKYQIRIG
jgi:hypothetical protein